MITKAYTDSLYTDCINAGAWYWLQAEGEEEHTESILHRMLYTRLSSELQTLAMPIPAPAELYSKAVERWPANKLHPFVIAVGGGK